MTDKSIQTCEACGASVYPEHLTAGKAAVVDGKLLCPFCLEDYKSTHHTEEQRFQGQTTMRAPGEGEDLEPIQIIDEEAVRQTTPAAVKSYSSDSFAGVDALVDEAEYKRPLQAEGQGATRCRTFHAKLNDGAVAFMNRQINEWADSHPSVSIKFATSTIGVWEGKKADPTLIITVFY